MKMPRGLILLAGWVPENSSGFLNTWTPETQHVDEAPSIAWTQNDTHWSIGRCQF